MWYLQVGATKKLSVVVLVCAEGENKSKRLFAELLHIDVVEMLNTIANATICVHHHTDRTWRQPLHTTSLPWSKTM
jgi:hypothetical protein